ncbi:BMP family protein [Streptomyces sp. NPDC048504]|uniref:BMP family lipoprotein n=1 Tax=Streptomyces sp. NPDC048504 TaxID=3365559 RepID=UPI003711BFE4
MTRISTVSSVNVGLVIGRDRVPTARFATRSLTDALVAACRPAAPAVTKPGAQAAVTIAAHLQPEGLTTMQPTSTKAIGIASLVLTLAACGTKQTTTQAGSTGSTSGYKACMVTDTGGVDDKSFNQSVWQGLQKAGTADVQYLSSATSSDFARNITALESVKCDLIFTVGFAMADATTGAAKASPKQHFAIIDNTGDKKNVQGLLFNTAQSAFMAGYLAAGYSKTGEVATYGGQDLAPVTAYMDGFWEGVHYYNNAHHKSVHVLGWDEKTRKGSFAGTFTDQTKGSQLAKNFIQAGADVIYPVAGGTGLGTAAAAQASGGKAAVIWVDTDGCVAAPQYCDVFLTTTYKGISQAVQTAVKGGAAGNYGTGDYVGTLANGGTGLSPYHDFASKVPQALQDEVAKVGKDIRSGAITITSKSQP